MRRHYLVLHHCLCGRGRDTPSTVTVPQFLESSSAQKTADHCRYQYNKTKMARQDRKLKEMLSDTLSSLESNRKFVKKATSFR